MSPTSKGSVWPSMHPVDPALEWPDWASNFAPIPVTLAGTRYRTGEHAYQAQKATNVVDRARIIEAPTPAAAKRIGNQIKCREDWARVRVPVMSEVVAAKFPAGSPEAKLLLEHDGPLIEWNNWHDTFWGVCNGQCRSPHVARGVNMLGSILIWRKVHLLIDKAMEEATRATTQ